MENLGWHFCAVRRGKPVLRDGRALEVGKWLEHTGPVEICVSGLHLSIRPLDALNYAPGLYVTRVEFSDVVETQKDKLVCRRRLPLYGFDATTVVLTWARRVASDVLHLWTAPESVKLFIATGENPRVAYAAAAAYAYAADRTADAAYAAAYAADAAYDAAYAAAAYAAYAVSAAKRAAAAADAAYAAYAYAAADAKGRYNEWLQEMLLEAAKNCG